MKINTPSFGSKIVMYTGAPFTRGNLNNIKKDIDKTKGFTTQKVPFEFTNVFPSFIFDGPSPGAEEAMERHIDARNYKDILVFNFHKKRLK